MVDLQKIKNEAIEKFEGGVKDLKEFSENRIANIKVKDYHALFSLNQQERIHLGYKSGDMRIRIFRVRDSNMILIVPEVEKK
jgi:hypothetical protein